MKMASQTESKCAHRVSEVVNRKRIVVCCDGTWNSANDSTENPTNVVRLSGAVAHKCCSGMPQIVYYHPGAGTESSKTASYLGGILGLGVAQDIVETYRFICDNYNPGDEIIIVGFSRGAFTARSVAGMVCALGFLNRAGLDQLPCIFKDYETWQKWGELSYNPKVHLAGFTMTNEMRLKRFKAAKERLRDPSKLPWDGSPGDLEEKLKAERETAFNTMSKMFLPGKDKQMDLRAMAKYYREMLRKHELSLTIRIPEADVDGKPTGLFKYEPVKGKVKAVGVWDTVGSLGIPRMPYREGRSEREIRFESLDVHPNVDYAFHALALDEWRSAFNCTMWDKKSDNGNTKLRQVWFPGSHCNAGGGWPDQQIATIALAWMADQLTSIGVEFSKVEMNRIFYELRPGARAHKWGLGPIRDPGGSTTYPDYAYSMLATPYRWISGADTDYPTRTPCEYKDDHGSSLVGTNEFVHPCVRLRYLYGGEAPEERKGVYQNRSLTGRGYNLESKDFDQETVRKCREERVLEETYAVVGGVTVTPFYDTPNLQIESIATAMKESHKRKLVRVEQPNELNDLYQLPPAKKHWAWVQRDKKGKETRRLPEEQIGMWERLFIKNNEKMLGWQAKVDAKAEADTKEKPKPKPLLKTRAGELNLKDVPMEYGYHDLVGWQTADMTINSSKER